MENQFVKNYYLVLKGYERLKLRIPIKAAVKALYDKINTNLNIFKRN